MWPWAGRPITGPLCWVPDPAAPSGPTRGVFCTGCCVAGSEASHLPELTRPPNSFLPRDSERARPLRLTLPETPPGPRSTLGGGHTWAWLSRCSQSSAAPRPHAPGAAPAPRPLLAWPGSSVSPAAAGRAGRWCVLWSGDQAASQAVGQAGSQGSAQGRASLQPQRPRLSILHGGPTDPPCPPERAGHGRGGGWVAAAQQREHGQAWSTTWGMGHRGVQCGFTGTWEGNHSSAFHCCGHNYSAGGRLQTGRRGRKKGKRGQVCTHRRAHTRVRKHEHAAWALVAVLGRPP